MHFSETSKGELAILGEALLYSLFPVLTVFSYATLPPLVSLLFSTLFAVAFFGCLMLAGRKTRELRNKTVWKYIPIVTLFISLLYYGLFFLGLSYTTANNGAIIGLMELFFSYLLFNVWRKETFSAAQTAGAGLMLLGAVIILFPKHGFGFHAGDWLILLAAASSPAGNYYQQKLRKIASSETILFLRSLLALPVFFCLSLLLKTHFVWSNIGRGLWFLAINGLLLLGLSKQLWIEGIHRISVTKANALSSIGPLFTLIFSYFILKQTPQLWQWLALLPIIAGIALLTSKVKIKKAFTLWQPIKT